MGARELLQYMFIFIFVCVCVAMMIDDYKNR